MAKIFANISTFPAYSFLLKKNKENAFLPLINHVEPCRNSIILLRKILFFQVFIDLGPHRLEA